MRDISKLTYMATTQSSVQPRFAARPAALIIGNILKDATSCATVLATRNATQRLPAKYFGAISASVKCNNSKRKDEKSFNEGV